MIFDHIDHLDVYKGLHSGLDVVIEALAQEQFLTSLLEREVGKHLLDERNFYLVQAYTPKSEVEGRLETHEKFIDLQLVLAGREKMGVANKRDLEATTSYSSLDDIQFYKGEYNWLTFEAGYFGVFFPEDAHMPGIVESESTQVRKIVFKIMLK